MEWTASAVSAAATVAGVTRWRPRDTALLGLLARWRDEFGFVLDETPQPEESVSPLLPEWLPQLELHGLRVGEAAVDLRFRRDRKGRSRFHVLGKRGKLRVVRQPPLDDLGAGFLRRLLALFARS